MATSAEDALAALARDLIEEISAGRAVELAQALRDDPEADLMELARFNVRPFQRTTTVHGRKVVEEVGAHTAERAGMPGQPSTPGPGGPKGSADITGAGLEHPGGWIPDADWVKGQAEWASKGEAIWKANQWKAHAKLHEGIGNTRQQINDWPRQPKNGPHIRNRFNETEASGHLEEAQKHLTAAREGGPADPGEHIAQAYSHLLQAHRQGTEEALPRAGSKEERAHVEEGLKQIRGHLDTLDKSMGMRKGSSSKPLEAEHAAGLDASKRQEGFSRVSRAVNETTRNLSRQRNTGSQSTTINHLTRAELILGSKAEPGSTAEAYHHLHEAHSTAVENLLSQAETPEEKKKVRELLDTIQGHMEALDQATGSDSKRTQQLLGGVGEQNERATVAKGRIEEEKKSAPNWMAPGRRVFDIRWPDRIETVEKAENGDYGPRVYTRDQTGHLSAMSLASSKDYLRPAPGEPPAPEGFYPLQSRAAETGMEGDLQRAQVEAMVGQPVTVNPEADDWHVPAATRILGGKPGIVTDIPEEIFDTGSEEWVPNNDPKDLWVNVKAAEGDRTFSAPASVLQLHQPEPPKGAEAVHPHLGGHLVRLPGETISQRNYSHVPRPVEMPPPVTPSTNERALSQQLGQAQQRIGQYAERDARQREEKLQQNLSEIRAREMEARGIAAPGTYQPLSDEQFAHHVSQLEETIADALRRGMATDQQFALDEHGTVWDPDRAQQHAEIISNFLDKQVDVPSDRQAIMLGGPPGAGKTTMLNQHEGIRPQDWANLNTDHFKEELAKRGMVPEVPGLSPMEASALVHNESAYLHDLAAAELEKRGKNLVFDGTMRDHQTTADRIQQLKRRGYNVGAMFIDVPVERSLQGVDSRYRRGLEEYRAGRNPLGGRHVPRSVVLSGESRPGRTKARDTFDALKGDFSWWERHGETGLAERSAIPETSGSIPSVEALRKQMQGGDFTGATEAEVRAREQGTNT